MTEEEKKEYQRKWYQAHKEEVKARTKKYYEEHKEEQLAKQKIKYEENKDAILARQKKYRDSHKEQITETAKRYRDNGGYKRHHAKYKEKRNAYSREYHEKNKEKRNTYHREYLKKYKETEYGLAKMRIGNYVKMDRDAERGDCTLTPDWFIEKIFNSSCIYCGDSDWTHLGADRIDNSKPHTPDNCVCSCGICNVERQCKSMSVSEFIKYRKYHPRTIDLKPEVVEINGVKVLRKKLVKGV